MESDFTALAKVRSILPRLIRNIRPLVPTRLEFYSQDSLVLHGSSHLEVCPFSRARIAKCFLSITDDKRPASIHSLASWYCSSDDKFWSRILDPPWPVFRCSKVWCWWWSIDSDIGSGTARQERPVVMRSGRWCTWCAKCRALELSYGKLLHK